MNNHAKKTGQRLGIISSVIGVLIAYFLMTFIFWGDGNNTTMDSILWISNDANALNMLVGAVGLIAGGYFFGGIAGKEIIIKKRNPILVGILTGLLVLWIGSTVGFVKGMDGMGNPFVDYYVKPMFWITILGVLPVVLVGIWFGKKIEKSN